MGGAKSGLTFSFFEHPLIISVNRIKVRKISLWFIRNLKTAFMFHLVVCVNVVIFNLNYNGIWCKSQVKFFSLTF